MTRIKLRPLERWPREETKSRTMSKFSASWGDTKELLEREVWNLKSVEAVMVLDVMERDIRTDGELTAKARPDTPRVGLLVERYTGRPGSESQKRETLAFYCDRYTDWQDNVRAIALSLEALRKVDRYGVTSAGEQYTGWLALTDGKMTHHDAARHLSTVTGIAVNTGDPQDTLRGAFLMARKLAHPDAGGSHETFTKVEEAGRVLGLTK